MDDSEMIRLFFERDEKALSSANEKYGKYCFAVAHGILKNTEEAEECVNDALMKAWDSIPPETPRNLPGFLAKITKNIAINRYNKEHTDKRGGSDIPLIYEELEECVPANADIEREFEQKELTAEINAFLGTLPQARRDLFLLRYWYCLSLSEAARRTGITENNAAVTLARIRKKLLNHLRKRGY